MWTDELYNWTKCLFFCALRIEYVRIRAHSSENRTLRIRYGRTLLSTSMNTFWLFLADGVVTFSKKWRAYSTVLVGKVPRVICLQKDCHLIYYFNSLLLVWVLRQWGVFDSVFEVILLRSVSLLYLPSFALTRQDYDCMLETVVHVSWFYTAR